jgi:hypothetical protein
MDRQDISGRVWKKIEGLLPGRIEQWGGWRGIIGGLSTRYVGVSKPALFGEIYSRIRRLEKYPPTVLSQAGQQYAVYEKG